LIIKLAKDKKELAVVCLSIFAVTIVIYGNTLGFSFVNWDDPLHITDNPLVQDFSFKNFFQNYEPIYLHTWFTHLIWGVIYKLSNGNPVFFHLINVIFHAINSIMIYYLAKFVLKNKLIPFVIAVLFVAHPLHVEAVVWASAFKDISFSFFYLLGILVYINYLNKNRVWKILLICLLYFLASSSKIQALHFPVVLVLIELLKNSKIVNKNIFLFLSLIFLGFRESYVFIIIAIILILMYTSLHYKWINKAYSLKFTTGLKLSVKLDFFTICLLFGFIFNISFKLLVAGFFSSLLVSGLIFGLIGFFYIRIKTSSVKNKNIKLNVLQGVLVAINLLLIYLFVSIDYILEAYDVRVFAYVLSFLFIVVYVLKLFKQRNEKVITGFKYISYIFYFSIIIFSGLIIFILFNLNGIEYLSGLYLWAADSEFHFTIIERILMSGYALVFYIKAFFIPIENIAVHPYPNFDIAGTMESFYPYLFVYLIIIFIAFLFIRTKKVNFEKKKQLFFGLLFFLINISFVLHIIPIHGRIIVADRYAYLAIFGLLVVLFVVLDKLLKSNKFYLVLFSLCLLFFYTYQSKSYSSVWSDSISLYDDVIKKNPDIAFPYNNKALFYYHQGNYDLALENYALAISTDSSYNNAYYNRGLLLLDIGDYNGAVSDFSLAIKYLPINDPEIFTSRGWTYYLLQNYELAINDYKAAIEIDSTYHLAYNNRALLKFDIGDFQGAFIDVDKAIEFNPNMHEAYNNRGWFKLNSDDVVGALHDFEQAYDLNPNFFNAVMNLAWTNFLDKNYHEAAKYYKEAYDLSPNNQQAIYYLGLSEFNCDNVDVACYYFRIASEMGHEDAYKMLQDNCSH
jgi:tetratricopeptide (TPR) repeat protein